MLVEEPDKHYKLAPSGISTSLPTLMFKVNEQLCGAPTAIVTCVGGGGLAMGILQVGSDSWSDWVRLGRLVGRSVWQSVKLVKWRCRVACYEKLGKPPKTLS